MRKTDPCTRRAPAMRRSLKGASIETALVIAAMPEILVAVSHRMRGALCEASRGICADCGFWRRGFFVVRHVHLHYAAKRWFPAAKAPVWRCLCDDCVAAVSGGYLWELAFLRVSDATSGFAGGSSGSPP